MIFIGFWTSNNHDCDDCDDNNATMIYAVAVRFFMFIFFFLFFLCCCSYLCPLPFSRYVLVVNMNWLKVLSDLSSSCFFFHGSFRSVRWIYCCGWKWWVCLECVEKRMYKFVGRGQLFPAHSNFSLWNCQINPFGYEWLQRWLRHLWGLKTAETKSSPSPFSPRHAISTKANGQECWDSHHSPKHIVRHWLSTYRRIDKTFPKTFSFLLEHVLVYL